MRPTSTDACSERASGGSGTMGTPDSVAMRRIFAAMRSLPFATTIGAAFSASYFSATA